MGAALGGVCARLLDCGLLARGTLVCGTQILQAGCGQGASLPSSSTRLAACGPQAKNSFYICNCLRKSKEYFVTCENDVKFKFRNHGHSVTCCPGASRSFKRKSASLILGCSLLPPVRGSPGKEP